MLATVLITQTCHLQQPSARAQSKQLDVTFLYPGRHTIDPMLLHSKCPPESLRPTQIVLQSGPKKFTVHRTPSLMVKFTNSWTPSWRNGSVSAVALSVSMAFATITSIVFPDGPSVMVNNNCTPSS